MFKIIFIFTIYSKINTVLSATSPFNSVCRQKSQIFIIISLSSRLFRRSSGSAGHPQGAAEGSVSSSFGEDRKEAHSQETCMRYYPTEYLLYSKSCHIW